MNELRIYPDPVLRDKAKLVEDFDSQRLAYIIKIMQKVMEEHEGAGIAAPQLGILEQIVVVNREVSNVDNGVFINPKIIDTKGKEKMEEGCLSIPGVELEIERHKVVVVSSFSTDGKENTIEASNLFARVLQHEIDHLNGILIIDKLTPQEKLEFNLKWNRGEHEKRHPSRVL